MNVEIAERLARRRREAGYSQENLAEKLGVSRQAVSKWERSESSPDTDNLIALAQLYGVSIDELLYVDDFLKDDVAFEAADRAAERRAQTQAYAPSGGSAVGAGAAGAVGAVGVGGAAGAGQDGSGPAGQNQWSANGRKTIYESTQTDSSGFRNEFEPDGDFEGIHIKDGDDYVHISWKEGVHIKDARKGDEVHVGWDGIHIKDGGGWQSSEDWSEILEDSEDANRFKAGVFVGNTDDGTWHHARNFLRKEYGTRSMWLRFPFPLVVIIAYILIGIFLEAWAIGLFVFFAIPVYYMIGHAIYARRPARFFEGMYPLACIVWFLWMAFVEGAPHPAWVIFLTIPVIEWIFHAISRSYRRRKKAARVIEAE